MKPTKKPIVSLKPKPEGPTCQWQIATEKNRRCGKPAASGPGFYPLCSEHVEPFSRQVQKTAQDMLDGMFGGKRKT